MSKSIIVIAILIIVATVIALVCRLAILNIPTIPPKKMNKLFIYYFEKEHKIKIAELFKSDQLVVVETPEPITKNQEIDSYLKNLEKMLQEINSKKRLTYKLEEKGWFSIKSVNKTVEQKDEYYMWAVYQQALNMPRDIQTSNFLFDFE